MDCRVKPGNDVSQAIGTPPQIEYSLQPNWNLDLNYPVFRSNIASTIGVAAPIVLNADFAAA
jgi:hypothetical protein